MQALPRSPQRTIAKRASSASRVHSNIAQRPSHLSAYRMEIGSWNETAEFNGVLTLKIYYSRGQIVLERMFRGRKRKIQYSMEDVDKIFLYHHTSRVSVVDFFVHAPPDCYCEIDPTPRSNTSWEACEDDFCFGQSAVAKFVRCFLKTTTSTKHFIRLQSHPTIKSKIFFRPPNAEDWVIHHSGSSNLDSPGAGFSLENKHVLPAYTGWSNLYVQHLAARLGMKEWDDGDSGDSSSTNSSLPGSPNSDSESLEEGIQGRDRILDFDILRRISLGNS